MMAGCPCFQYSLNTFQLLLILGSCKYWKQLLPRPVVKSIECQVCPVPLKFLHKSEKDIFYQRRKNVIKDFYSALKFIICLFFPSLWTCLLVRSDSQLKREALIGQADFMRLAGLEAATLLTDAHSNTEKFCRSIAPRIFFSLTKAFCFMSSFETGFVKSSNCLYEQGQFAPLLLQNEQTSTS